MNKEAKNELTVRRKMILPKYEQLYQTTYLRRAMNTQYRDHRFTVSVHTNG